MNKVAGRIFLLLFVFHLFDTNLVHAFRDKKGREIKLSWDITLTEDDMKVSHRSYLPQKKHYEERGIEFTKFFDEYNDEMVQELFLERRFPAESKEREFHLLRATHADRSVGFAYFKKRNKVGSAFFLEFIALDPEYQACGIGGELLFEIRRKFERLRRLSLDTRVFNTNGQKFYESLSFTPERGKKVGYLHYVWDLNRSHSLRKGVVDSLPYDLYELNTFGSHGLFIPSQYPFLIPPVVEEGVGLQVTKKTKDGKVISGIMAVMPTSLIKQQDDVKSVPQMGESEFEAFLSEFPDRKPEVCNVRICTKDLSPLYSTIYGELTSRGFHVASIDHTQMTREHAQQILLLHWLASENHESIDHICRPSKPFFARMLGVGIQGSYMPEMGTDQNDNNDSSQQPNLLYALDIDGRMGSAPKLTLLPGNLQDFIIPLYTYYDIVYMNNVLQSMTLEGAFEALEKVYDLLDAGASFSATTFSNTDDDAWFLDPLKIGEMLEKIGFVEIGFFHRDKGLSIRAYKPMA